MFVFPPDHLVEGLPAHADSHQAHEDNHQVHEDDCQAHTNDHQAHIDNHQVHVDNLLALIEDHQSHAENNDHLVLMKNLQVHLKNLQGGRPVHLVLKNHLLVPQTPVLIAGHQVLTENLIVRVSHLVQISYHQENPWSFVKKLVRGEVPAGDHPDNGQ